MIQIPVYYTKDSDVEMVLDSLVCQEQSRLNVLIVFLVLLMILYVIVIAIISTIDGVKYIVVVKLVIERQINGKPLDSPI